MWGRQIVLKIFFLVVNKYVRKRRRSKRVEFKTYATYQIENTSTINKNGC